MKELLKELNEKEMQKEEEEMKEIRETWKKKRREELERDKKVLAEADRQINLVEVAKKFHRHLLIKQYGLRPWLKLLHHLKVEYSDSEKMYQTTLKRCQFHDNLQQFEYKFCSGEFWNLGGL